MKEEIKNFICIDVDTTRKNNIIKLTKPASMAQPTNFAETANMVLLDISCIAEALATLIYIAGENKYADKNELINASIKTLYRALETPNNDSAETPLSDEPQTNS